MNLLLSLKILIKSIIIYIFGLYIDIFLRRINSCAEKCFEKYGSLSSLAGKSDRCYSLILTFSRFEKSLKSDFLLLSEKDV